MIISHQHPVSMMSQQSGQTQGDGGYLIPDDFDSCCMLSPGVSSISGFARDCTDRNIRMHLADAPVDAPALEPLLLF